MGGGDMVGGWATNDVRDWVIGSASRNAGAIEVAASSRRGRWSKLPNYLQYPTNEYGVKID